MDILDLVVRLVTYDAYLGRDGYPVQKHRRELRRSQFLPAVQLRDLQLRTLRQIVSHAFDNNPFYRDRFTRAGFHPSDLKSLSDLAGLPLLTKDDIRSGLSGSFSRGYTPDNSLHKRTGGSTGVPVHVYIDKAAWGRKRAAVERHDGWAGWRPGLRMAAVWGNTTKRPPWRARLRNTLSSRACYLDTLQFTEARLENFVAYLRRARPPLLFGHAHSVYRLAEYVDSLKGPPIRFRSVITTAMTLSPGERARIEEVFASPVFNRYGCEELSIIASECDQHSGLHVFAEGVFLEYLDPPAPGLPHPLVVTDLLNHAMPLIRYEIGDLAIPADKPCPCGRGLPLLSEVSGRTADFLYTPEGKPVFGISILDTFVIHIPGIRQAQIVQDRLNHIRIRLVRDAGFNDDTLTRLGQAVVEIFGPGMKWDAEFVDSIGTTAAGKYRFSICEIPGSESSVKAP